MAELSREAPVLVLEQQLSAEDYAQAALLYENTLFPFRRYWVRAGVCICAAVLVASMIPWYLSRFSTAFVPACGVVFFLALALYFWREQPRRRLHGAVLQFCGNSLLRLPGKISIYQNGIVLENDVETLSEFWTDFSGCVEGHAYYVLWGGISRPLLILKKSALSPEQAERLSAHLRNTFARRCRLANGGRFR
ncbi:YcxB family protein [Faecalispora anaeroviscerum]|uniref:YcxB family protein n=1 Tax=Faecalispora anaeroviscerum TaxID=2991836 RepID=UPI0024BBC8C2|nr:YcxB family protein [Faecalispora anaeroviscerum]